MGMVVKKKKNRKGNIYIYLYVCIIYDYKQVLRGAIYIHTDGWSDGWLEEQTIKVEVVSRLKNIALGFILLLCFFL